MRFLKKIKTVGIPVAAMLGVAAAPMMAKASLVGAGSSNIIMVGDSRAEGMYYTVGQAGCTWEYETGKGYSWMTSTAIPQIDSLVGSGTSVVIMLGVNDIGSTSYATQYATYLNDKAAEWKTRGADTYYVSVTKCADGYSSAYGVDNNHIDAWNTQIQSDLSDDVIYLNADAMLGIPSTVDGLHYTADSYTTLFNYIYGAVYSAQMSRTYSEQQITNIYTEETDAPGLNSGNRDTDMQVKEPEDAAQSDNVQTVQAEENEEAAQVIADDADEETIIVPEETDAETSEDQTGIIAGVVGTDEVTTRPDGSIAGVVGDNVTGGEIPTLSIPVIERPEETVQEETQSTALIPDEEIVSDDAAQITVLTPDMVGQELIIDEEETETQPQTEQTELTEDQVAALFGKKGDAAQPLRPDAGDMLAPHIGTAANSEALDQTPIAIGWVENETGKQYYAPSGKPVTGINEIDGKTYYFDASGYVQTNALCYLDNGAVLTDAEGVLKTGWQTKDDRTYHFADNGIADTGVKSVDGNLYCFAADGSLRTGVFAIDGQMYVADENGVLQDGWITIDGIQYYCKNGVAVTGLQQIDDAIYRFNEMGVLSISDRTGSDSVASAPESALQNNGLIADAEPETEPGTETETEESNADDAMLDERIDVQITDIGEIVEGWHSDEHGRYYVNGVGDVLTGWQRIQGKTYYMDSNGYTQTDLVRIGNGVWMFDHDGVLQGSLEDGPLAETMDTDLFDNEVYFRAYAAYCQSDKPKDLTVTMQPETDMTLNASYEECYIGDVFDASKVHVTLTDNDGIGSVISTYTVGDVTAAPTILTGDVQMNIVTPYGQTQLVIRPQAVDKAAMDEAYQTTYSRLVGWYDDTVYEGDTLLRSALHLVGKTEDGSWQTVQSYELSQDISEPITDKVTLSVHAGKARTKVEITPVPISYVEADLPKTPNKGEVINPTHIILGFDDGTYRKVPIDECVFGIAPNKKKLLEGANYFPFKWHGKEYTMVASAKVE